ncbi:MAG: glutamyl-tRNA reductase [Vampirovibrionia bacterium]
MYLLVTGVRYKNAPIDVRERLSFSHKILPEALNKLKQYPSINEVVILNTCNRTEIYVVTDKTDIAMSSIYRFLADFHNVDISKVRKYMFSLMHNDTIRHLFNVASGLDSMIIGEHQIVNQVKECFSIAQSANSVDLILERLFKSALYVSKKVRTDTNIQSSIHDIPSGAVELARRYFSNLSELPVAVIGSGEMANLTVDILHKKFDCKQVTCLCRDTSKICSNKVDLDSIVNLENVLNKVELVFVCTSAPHFIITRDNIVSDNPLFIVDISVPRNVEPSVAYMDSIQLFNTDDIQTILDEYSSEKEKQMLIADYIIDQESKRFANWMNNLDLIPTLKKIRYKIEDIRKDKLNKLRSDNCPFSKEKCLMVDTITKQLVNTILHNPTVNITSNKTKEEVSYITNLLREMFDLDSEMYKEFNND